MAKAQKKKKKASKKNDEATVVKEAVVPKVVAPVAAPIPVEEKVEACDPRNPRPEHVIREFPGRSGGTVYVIKKGCYKHYGGRKKILVR